MRSIQLFLTVMLASMISITPCDARIGLRVGTNLGPIGVSTEVAITAAVVGGMVVLAVGIIAGPTILDYIRVQRLKLLTPDQLGVALNAYNKKLVGRYQNLIDVAKNQNNTVAREELVRAVRRFMHCPFGLVHFVNEIGTVMYRIQKRIDVAVNSCADAYKTDCTYNARVGKAIIGLRTMLVSLQLMNGLIRESSAYYEELDRYQLNSQIATTSHVVVMV